MSCRRLEVLLNAKIATAATAAANAWARQRLGRDKARSAEPAIKPATFTPDPSLQYMPPPAATISTKNHHYRYQGGLSVCIWEARQSGRPGDKYKLRYMEADHEDEENACKNTCLTPFDRYPWRLFSLGGKVHPSALTGKVSEG